MEEDIKVQVCRLCFNLISDKNFFSIKDSLKDMLQIITTDLDLNVTNSPVMCQECSKSLQEIFNFKTNFFESEERIDSKITNIKHKQLKLRDLMNNRPQRRATRVKLENNEFCRTCLETIEGNAFIALKENLDVCLPSMLDSCLPELDLDLISDPVMCHMCYETLQKMANFKTVCEKNESQIEAYLKGIDANLPNKVNLHSVIHFLYNQDTQSNVCEGIVIKNEPAASNGKVKTEDHDEEQYQVKDCLQFVMVKMEPDNEEYESGQEIREVKKEYVMVKMEITGDDHDNVRNSSLNNTEVEHVKVKTEGKLNNHRSTRSGKRSKQNNAKDKIEETSLTYCTDCNFKTKYKHNLKRHLVVTHKRKDVVYPKKFYQCEQCDFATKWNIDLTRHMLSHVKPEALQCTRCPYSTNQNSLLIKHILSHVNADNMDKYSFLQLHKKTH